MVSKLELTFFSISCVKISSGCTTSKLGPQTPDISFDIKQAQELSVVDATK